MRPCLVCNRTPCTCWWRALTLAIGLFVFAPVILPRPEIPLCEVVYQPVGTDDWVCLD